MSVSVFSPLENRTLDTRELLAVSLLMVAKAAGGGAVPVTVLTYVAARVGVSALHTTSTIQVQCPINLKMFLSLSHPSPHTPYLTKYNVKRVELPQSYLVYSQKINYLLKFKCTSYTQELAASVYMAKIVLKN